MTLNLALIVKDKFVLATTEDESLSFPQILEKFPMVALAADRVTLFVSADFSVDINKYSNWFNFLNESTATFEDYLEQLMLVHTVISFENRSNCKPEFKVMGSDNKEVQLNVWNAWKSMRQLKDLKYQTVTDLFGYGEV